MSSLQTKSFSKKDFSGVFTALVTPMKDGAIDLSAFNKLLLKQLRSGINGLVPVGTTGEAVTLSEEELELIISTTVEVVQKESSNSANIVPVMPGVGSNDTKKTISMAKKAERLGANALLVVTPYYNKPTQEGLYRHFYEVASSVSIPICVYNVPSRTSVNIEPKTLARLSQIENIWAVKDASGTLTACSEIMHLTQNRFQLFSGDDVTALAYTAQGGVGVISVLSNIFPLEIRLLIESVKANNLSRARELHHLLYPLMSALFIETNPVPVKTALSFLNEISTCVRLPLCEMEPSNANTLKTILNSTIDALKKFSY